MRNSFAFLQETVLRAQEAEEAELERQAEIHARAELAAAKVVEAREKAAMEKLAKAAKKEARSTEVTPFAFLLATFYIIDCGQYFFSFFT